MSRTLPTFWQHRGWQSLLLMPLSWLFSLLLRIRRFAHARQWLRTEPSALPVVVVGNLSVGGTGKSPLCAELARRLALAGWRPAIVSRGYGGERQESPHLLQDRDTPAQVGDEPVMLRRQTGVPVCVCVDRAAAVAHVAAQTDADIILSDDGLQHLRMQRVADIVVIDAARGFGNSRVLPAGPLREPESRLSHAHLVAIQVPYVGEEGQAGDVNMHASLHACLRHHVGAGAEDQCFSLIPDQLIQLCSNRRMSLQTFHGQRVHAVAGIGNPQRFFDSLQACGLVVDGHALPDHHDLSMDDLCFDDDLPVLITAKDAVKLPDPNAVPATIHEVGTRLRMSKSLEQAVTELEQTLRSHRLEPGDKPR